MASFKSIPVIRPYTYRTNMGPGCERGARYYPQETLDRFLGEQTRKLRWQGMDAACECLLPQMRTETNDPNTNYATLYSFSYPDSHRSCVVSHNKDGLWMNSRTRVEKIGSKHMANQDRNAKQHAMPEAARRPPNAELKFWDYGIVGKEAKTTNEDIGAWSPLWYRAVNEQNVYGNYNPKTLQLLGGKEALKTSGMAALSASHSAPSLQKVMGETYQPSVASSRSTAASSRASRSAREAGSARG